MQRTTIVLLFALAAFAGGASAETPGTQLQPKCLKAEVNPVTGQVLCIDPLGAPVGLCRQRRYFPASRSSRAASGLGLPTARRRCRGCEAKALAVLHRTIRVDLFQARSSWP
jgi:hypothetical protein